MDPYTETHSETVFPGEIELGSRPFELLSLLEPGPLKSRLQACVSPYQASPFSIAHRGAPLKYPEHTREGYIAAARMGAGLIECDVTFTADGELVCRHGQCDLAETTHILVTDLAARCRQPFTPMQDDPGHEQEIVPVIVPAKAQCCTSDLTLAEFKSLKGKMAGYDPHARTVDEYLQGNPTWRGNALPAGGTLMSLAEAIRLFEQLDVQHIPELKSAEPEAVNRVFGSQDNYAQALVDAYKVAGVSPQRVFLQSFNLDDIVYWIEHESEFGKQALYLTTEMPDDLDRYFADLVDRGLNIIAPPIPLLLTTDSRNNIVPTPYALKARQAGLEIITWSLERSGPINDDMKKHGDFYYQSILPALKNDGDIYRILDTLAQDVGVKGVFSDWPATVALYANAYGLGLEGQQS